MHTDGSAPLRAPFLQTPEALIDDTRLTDAALRLLQGMVKLPPRNARNSDAVAHGLRMGKEKTNAARKLLRSCGHWHARKRQNAEGRIRDQRLASLVPLRTAEEVAAGWAAAEEAARLGKDTAASRRLGVRVLNSIEWQRRDDRRTLRGEPAAGAADVRTTRRRLPGEDHRGRSDQTPLPVPAGEGGRALPDRRALPDELVGHVLDGPLARYAEQAERALLRLRFREPRLTLPPAEARTLAQLAGHHLLRGATPGDLLTVLTQGLPPEGVRCPAGFVRDRLVRYLPPLPRFPTPTDTPPVRAEADPPPYHRPGPETAVNRPDGPAARIAGGAGWREVLAAAGGAGQDGEP